MEKEFIPYEIALALKELGFNENCIATFDEDKNFELQDFEQNYDTFPKHIIARPLYQQAFRWFREKYNLSYCIESHYTDEWFFFYKIEGIDKRYGENKDFDTYEEAELACLKKLIEIVKNYEKHIFNTNR